MIEDQIRSKLSEGLSFQILDVTNESHQHSVPANSETHFRVLVVSSDFEALSRIVRHRRVHALLRDELSGGVHALALDAWTPAEWAAHDGKPSLSPRCLGGSKTKPRSKARKTSTTSKTRV